MCALALAADEAKVPGNSERVYCTLLFLILLSDSLTAALMLASGLRIAFRTLMASPPAHIRFPAFDVSDAKANENKVKCRR